MTRAAAVALLVAVPEAALAQRTTDPGAVWIQMLDECLDHIDGSGITFFMGRGWMAGRTEEISETLRLYTNRHRETGAHAETLVEERPRPADPRRIAVSCGTGVVRHFPGPRVAAATEAWAAARIAEGVLTDTGRQPGLDRRLEPVADQVWTYRWCGRRAGASIRLDMSDFPPARMEVNRTPPCEEVR